MLTDRRASSQLEGEALSALFKVPLRDLGEFEPRFAGIFSPGPEIGKEKIGITQQFLREADVYHARYSNSSHFMRLYKEAFDAAGVQSEAVRNVLDLGTGSGTNSLLPCLQLFNDCRIVATDLSPELLLILYRYVRSQGLEQRVACVCTDAMSNYFRPESFEVVVGSAILHHLLDPGQVLKWVQETLKPGGVAVFMEPFEGLGLLRIAFDLILRRAQEGAPLDETTAEVLTALRLDLATRAGSDKSAPHFQHMDDKWLFTRHYLETEGKRAGFVGLTLVPHAFHGTLFRDYTETLLQLAARLEPGCLPDWAWQTITLLDSLSPEMKRDVPLEASIIFCKG